MDEVRVERLIQKYKDSGELASEDPALVMLKKWPASKQYRDNSDRLPGLEQLVCIMYKISTAPACHTLENLVTHRFKKFGHHVTVRTYVLLYVRLYAPFM